VGGGNPPVVPPVLFLEKTSRKKQVEKNKSKIGQSQRATPPLLRLDPPPPPPLPQSPLLEKKVENTNPHKEPKAGSIFCPTSHEAAGKKSRKKTNPSCPANALSCHFPFFS
jgi:hypothetical protein